VDDEPIRRRWLIPDRGNTPDRLDTVESVEVVGKMGRAIIKVRQACNATELVDINIEATL
jgi:hypothetical protein